MHVDRMVAWARVVRVNCPGRPPGPPSGRNVGVNEVLLKTLVRVTLEIILLSSAYIRRPSFYLRRNFVVSSSIYRF